MIPREHNFIGSLDLWPYVISITIAEWPGGPRITYHTKNQSKDRLRWMVRHEWGELSLYIEDTYFGSLMFRCRIVEIYTKGGVVLKDADEMLDFIAS